MVRVFFFLPKIIFCIHAPIALSQEWIASAIHPLSVSKREYSSNTHKVEVGGDSGETFNQRPLSHVSAKKEENEKEMERITIYGMGVNVGLSLIKVYHSIV